MPKVHDGSSDAQVAETVYLKAVRFLVRQPDREEHACDLTVRILSGVNRHNHSCRVRLYSLCVLDITGWTALVALAVSIGTSPKHQDAAILLAGATHPPVQRAGPVPAAQPGGQRGGLSSDQGRARHPGRLWQLPRQGHRSAGALLRRAGPGRRTASQVCTAANCLHPYTCTDVTLLHQTCKFCAECRSFRAPEDICMHARHRPSGTFAHCSAMTA